MRKRTAKWSMLLALSAPTLYVGCPANIGLEILNSMMSGVYSGAQVWGANAMMDFLNNLQTEPAEESAEP